VVAPGAIPGRDTKVLVPPEPERKRAKGFLVAVGFLLMALFVAGLIAGRVYGTQTEETSTPTSSGTTEATTTGASGATAAGAAASATSTSGATMTTKTTTKNFGSDSLLTAMLASGAALFALGFLYTRISAVKLPGGAEIDLNPEEKDKVKEEVQKRVKDGEVVPEAAPAVTLAAVDQARAAKMSQWGSSSELGNPVVDWGTATSGWGSGLSDEEVAQSVDSAVARHGATGP
jgi:hypothetical protein